MIIEITCPNEECPNFYDTMNVDDKDYAMHPNNFRCSQCQSLRVEKSTIPNPEEVNYKLTKDYTTPNETFPESTTKMASEWSDILGTDTETFRLEVLNGSYKEWFEKDV